MAKRVKKKAYVRCRGGSISCTYGCIGCGLCVAACHLAAIKIEGDAPPVVDRDKCVGCGLCANACPQHLIEVILPDRVFRQHHGDIRRFSRRAGIRRIARQANGQHKRQRQDAGPLPIRPYSRSHGSPSSSAGEDVPAPAPVGQLTLLRETETVIFLYPILYTTYYTIFLSFCHPRAGLPAPAFFLPENGEKH